MIDQLRRTGAELLGSALLAAAVVGSGIAASRLSPSDTGLQLLENALATTFALAVIIAVLGPLSGAHVNPVVTVADAVTRGRPWRDVAAYVPAQIVGCLLGAVLANLMFGLGAVTWSTNERATVPTLLAEVVATAGLVLTIFALARTGRAALATAIVPVYIGGAYFFTSSTSFANPAITIGRMVSDTFSGIAPDSVLPFIGAQVVGAGVGVGLAIALVPVATPAAHQVSAPASDVGPGR